MPSTAKRSPAGLVQEFVRTVERDWSPSAYRRLGASIQQALVMQEAYNHLAVQDDTLRPERFRTLTDDLYLAVRDHFEAAL